jgi:hypothetical protein
MARHMRAHIAWRDAPWCCLLALHASTRGARGQ